MSDTLFTDEHFLNSLVTLLVQDRHFLRSSENLLSPKDFKASSNRSNGNGNGHGSDAMARWIVSKIAIDYFDKYRDPVKKLLTAEIIDYCKKTHREGSDKERLLSYAHKILHRKVKAVSAITDKVLQFKKEQLKATAVQELIQLQSSGKLTDDKWMDICRNAIDVVHSDPFKSSDYYKGLEGRIERRGKHSDDRYPVLFIDPFDSQVRAISRKHMGLVIAPYKRGKSLMLIWIALAMTLQKLNVLYFTLEDPMEDVEDRFDAAVTHLPLKKLSNMPKKVRQRFKQYRRLVRSRLKIIDATEGGLTVPMVETIWERERDQGFTADVTIVDYDEEIKATHKQQERRMEFADIYRDFRQFASKKSQILWLAAQTKRATAGMQKLSGDDLAEDISKIRKVSMAISIGQGEWGEDSLYLHVAAHKYDKQFVGCNIMPDKERMLIYDRDKTLAYMAKPPRQTDDLEEE